MSELPKAYNPKDYEDKIYSTWEESGFFNPDHLEGKDPFCIIMPPPNTTGVLHLGHASSIAYEDLMIRYARLQGKKALYLPGTDHAAIATQSRVESELAKEGKTRHDLGREAFLQRTKDYVAGSQETIKKQIRVMGASCDWSRERYTLEEASNRAVNEVFKKMYDDGLIYRGDRIINWDTKLQTTVSDDELNWEEENTKFYYFKYGPFEIGTARPETKFGDKYVVMHPDDARYKQYKHGDTIDLEWINGPVTATIIKDEAVDPEFGTGVMTITPWHDATDFEIAERHNLDKQQIIDFDGKLMDIAAEFAGQDILEARPKIVEKLKSKGLLSRVEENYTHRIARSDRGGVIVEPQIKRQWFIDVNKKTKNGKTLKEMMQSAVRSGDIKIIPARFDKVYFDWVDNLRDWCISRQIWWGHRIPVWYKGEEVYCNTQAPEGSGWEQDPDTLDTWFSSALWTFSTLLTREHKQFKSWEDWVKNSPDLFYHPTSVLETGYDIIFFWVARMVLMSYYVMDEKPFSEVYLHGLIRDKEGRKMSKSLDNGIDPIVTSDNYGTDALRLSLIIGATPGNDLRLYDEKIAGYRNFVNKLWNISRFILLTVGDNRSIEAVKLQSLADKWIWSEHQKNIKTVTEAMENRSFSAAAESLYEFTWSKLADWYLEIAKVENSNDPESKLVRDNLLLNILRDLLVMWHPFTPFVTEVIWQQLKQPKLLIVSSWPSVQKTTDVNQDFAKLQELVVSIRNLRADNKVPAGSIVPIAYFGQTDIEDLKPVIERLARVEFGVGVKGLELKGSWFRIVLGFTGNKKDQDKLKDYIEKLEAKLANEDFVAKAPPQVVEEEKRKLDEAKAKLN